MPRAIIASASDQGIATYKLSPHEEFTVGAITFNLINVASGGGDSIAYLDFRDPNGALIHLQPLATGDGAEMFYSLATDASEFNWPNVNTLFIPQDIEGFGFNYVSQRLSRQTLYAQCTVNAYKTFGTESPPTDPITNVDPGYSIPDLHLWVEDTGEAAVASQRQQVVVGPFMLVPGPAA